MKRLTQSFIFLLLIGTTQPSFAQETVNQKNEAENSSAFRINCRQVQIDTAKKITTLLYVSFMKNDKLSISDATKIVFDSNTKQYVIYDCKEFSFDGKVVIRKDKALKNVLRYQLYDEEIYLE